MNISTRGVTLADSDFLLKLKNDPSSRRFSIVTNKKIKKKAHERWLKRTLRRKNVLYFLIMTDGKKPCGTVRFDLSYGKAEIAIHVAKPYRGKGIATQIIGTIGDSVANEYNARLTARIVDSNMRSMVVFLKNGFYLVEHKDGVSHLERA